MKKKLVKIFKALGDANRLRIVNMLSQKPLCVCEITTILNNPSQSTVSGHLRVLKEAELITDKKDGLWVEYYLDNTNQTIRSLLDTILETLSGDPQMENDKETAQKADRNVICKK